jgi:hypothetical protein
MAYPTKKVDDQNQVTDILKHAPRLKLKNTRKEVLRGTVSANGLENTKEKKKKHAVKTKQAVETYPAPKESGAAYTIYDIVEHVNSYIESKSADKADGTQVIVIAHDERIVRLLKEQTFKGNSRVDVIASSDPRDTHGSVHVVEFDTSKHHMTPFHHNLRGIEFNQIDEVAVEEDTGGLVLYYKKRPNGASEKKAIIVDQALRTYSIHESVSHVYYIGAHLIQSRGQARFECFRASGDLMKRTFVGTHKEYERFIDILVGERCTDNRKPDTKVSPMMLETSIRRYLLMGYTIVIAFRNESDIASILSDYLGDAMRAWGRKYVHKQVASTEPYHISIEIKKEGNTPRTIKVDDIDLAPKPDIMTYKPSKKSDVHRNKTGTLLVFDGDYDTKTIKETDEIKKDSYVLDIRGYKACRSMITDLCTVRCKIAIFVGVKSPDDITWYQCTRILAETYLFCEKAEDLTFSEDQQ